MYKVILILDKSTIKTCPLVHSSVDKTCFQILQMSCSCNDDPSLLDTDLEG